MKKSLFNYHILNFIFFVNVSSLADPPRAKLSIGCLFAHPGQISRCTARSTHVRRFDSSKGSGGTEVHFRRENYDDTAFMMVLLVLSTSSPVSPH